MQLKHLEFHTLDGLDLPGLLYEPDQKTDKVAILLHGNGSSSIFSTLAFLTAFFGTVVSSAGPAGATGASYSDVKTGQLS